MDVLHASLALAALVLIGTGIAYLVGAASRGDDDPRPGPAIDEP